jgi:hypothetical protein
MSIYKLLTNRNGYRAHDSFIATKKQTECNEFINTNKMDIN